ncbi:iron-sulfur cluster repair di-iron protein [Melioribacteraceae bacterium 4301-Me]|uniref:iron-sulfur cluster repair di-iron protein n=1 Tax=Pyranulibacter aquaticus TaxID=3163344 RepID=UPI003599AAB3
MNDFDNKTIAEIVAEDYRAAKIFESYKIDFCCNGNKKFDTAVKEKNIDPQKIITELTSLQKDNNNNAVDFKSWPLDLLADYIEKKHHRYIEERTPEIKEYLAKLCQVHGNNHPELFEINDLFNQSAGQLAMHMKKEELILFPYIRKIAAAKQKNEKVNPPQFGSVENPISAMMIEHDVEGERFKKINELSNNYIVPDDGCNTYQLTYSLLKEFEEDLHIHIHLENNILFPSALKLEKEMTAE